MTVKAATFPGPDDDTHEEVLEEPVHEVAIEWRSNADMIVDMVQLGYLRDSDRIVDMTYGRGKWWGKWREPDVGYDLFETFEPGEAPPHLVTGVDFRRIVRDGHERERSADVAAFDPPYVCVGGRETTTLPDFTNRYGIDTAPSSPAKLHEMNAAGLAEAYWLLVPGGVALVKCADYVSSGHLQPASHWLLDRALSLGFQLLDRFYHVGHVRAQPERTRKCGTCKGTAVGPPIDGPGGVGFATCPDCVNGRQRSTQVHARQNLSHLFVLRKAKR